MTDTADAECSLYISRPGDLIKLCQRGYIGDNSRCHRRERRTGLAIYFLSFFSKKKFSRLIERNVAGYIGEGGRKLLSHDRASA
jgi:hypothetical protein